MSKLAIEVTEVELRLLAEATEAYTHIQVLSQPDKVVLKFYQETSLPLILEFAEYKGD